jgi:hypothetical protein
MRQVFAGRNFSSAGFIVLAAAILTTGCSPAFYGLARGHYPYGPPYGRPHQPVVEQVPTGRWDNVMRLPHGSTIDVLGANGAATIGAILGADIDSVRVAVDGAEVRIARADIVRVDLIDLAGSEFRAVTRKAARGALLGVGAAALIGGVIGGEAWPPPGPALRAGAAIGGVSAGQATLFQRAGRLIYLAPQQFGQPPTTTYR